MEQKNGNAVNAENSKHRVNVGKYSEEEKPGSDGSFLTSPAINLFLQNFFL